MWFRPLIFRRTQSEEFAQKHGLTMHQYKHTGVSPFHCLDCDRYFRSGSELRRHVLTHREKTLKCEECGKTFSHIYKALCFQKDLVAISLELSSTVSDLMFICI